MLHNAQRSHIRLIRDGGEEGGGRGTYERLVRALRPVKTEETVSRYQNNSVQEVGTPPVPNNLSTPQLALSTVIRNKVTEKVSEKAAVEEQTHLAMRAQLHLPDLQLHLRAVTSVAKPNRELCHSL